MHAQHKRRADQCRESGLARSHTVEGGQDLHCNASSRDQLHPYGGWLAGLPFGLRQYETRAVSWRSTCPTPAPKTALDVSWYTRMLLPAWVKSAHEHCSVTVYPVRTEDANGAEGKVEELGAAAVGQTPAAPGQLGRGAVPEVAVTFNGSNTW